MPLLTTKQWGYRTQINPLVIADDLAMRAASTMAIAECKKSCPGKPVSDFRIMIADNPDFFIRDIKILLVEVDYIEWGEALGWPTGELVDGR